MQELGSHLHLAAAFTIEANWSTWRSLKEGFDTFKSFKNLLAVAGFASASAAASASADLVETVEGRRNGLRMERRVRERRSSGDLGGVTAKDNLRRPPGGDLDSFASERDLQHLDEI